VAKTFDQIADEQGWNDDSIIHIELSYATSAYAQGMTLAQYAQEIADEENENSEGYYAAESEARSILAAQDFGIDFGGDGDAPVYLTVNQLLRFVTQLVLDNQ